MRRGIPSLMAVAVLGSLTSTMWAQYPYPYAPPASIPMPMPGQYMPGYGYPVPVMGPPMYPAYPPPMYPANLPPRPVYNYPPPMQAPLLRTLNFGPLDRGVLPAAAASVVDLPPPTNPAPAPTATNASPAPTKTTAAKVKSA